MLLCSDTQAACREVSGPDNGLTYMSVLLTYRKFSKSPSQISALPLITEPPFSGAESYRPPSRPLPSSLLFFTNE